MSQNLEEMMGHEQDPTLMRFDNKCAEEIMNDTFKQKMSKEMNILAVLLAQR